MKIVNKISVDQIPQLWVLGIVFIYGLIVSVFINSIIDIIYYSQPGFTPSKVFTYIISLNYVLIIIMSFVIWIITTFIYHLFAMLLGGVAGFRQLQKMTGLANIIPAIVLFISINLIGSIDTPNSDIVEFFESNKKIELINWLTIVAVFLYYAIVILVVKYLYKINWLKSIGAILIPMGSIYLLGQFFAKYIL